MTTRRVRLNTNAVALGLTAEGATSFHAQEGIRLPTYLQSGYSGIKVDLLEAAEKTPFDAYDSRPSQITDLRAKGLVPPATERSSQNNGDRFARIALPVNHAAARPGDLRQCVVWGWGDGAHRRVSPGPPREPSRSGAQSRPCCNLTTQRNTTAPWRR